MPASFLQKQVESILEDIAPDAVKIGMLYSPANIRKVAGMIRKHRLANVVLDPVLKATTGKPLIESDVLSLLKTVLAPVVTVVTPNLDEASLLSGRRVENVLQMEDAARAIHKTGPNVIVTGGHLKSECVDVLFDGNEMLHFRSDKIRFPAHPRQRMRVFHRIGHLPRDHRRFENRRGQGSSVYPFGH